MKQNLPTDLFKIILNGKYLSQDETTIVRNHDLFVNVSLPLVGGKGGFGSMLRAIGAQIEKTTNKEACRDLSGRRLRDVNAEKRIKNWIRRKAELEKEQERKKREKLERLTQQPKIDFKDDEYLKEKDTIPQKVDDAIGYILKKKKKRSNTASAKSSTVTSSETNLKSSTVTSSENSSKSSTITSGENHTASASAKVDENNQTCSDSNGNSDDSSDLNNLENKSSSDQPGRIDHHSDEHSKNNKSTDKMNELKAINKRKAAEPVVVSKKKRVQLWLGDDLDDSDDSGDE